MKSFIKLGKQRPPRARSCDSGSDTSELLDRRDSSCPTSNEPSRTNSMTSLETNISDYDTQVGSNATELQDMIVKSTKKSKPKVRFSHNLQKFISLSFIVEVREFIVNLETVSIPSSLIVKLENDFLNKILDIRNKNFKAELDWLKLKRLKHFTRAICWFNLKRILYRIFRNIFKTISYHLKKIRFYSVFSTNIKFLSIYSFLNIRCLCSRMCLPQLSK